MFRKALIYYNWVRFATDIVLDGRSFVVINMDETAISSVDDLNDGLRTRRPPQDASRSRPLDPVDRSNFRTTLLASVCDSAALQPLLPQVILPKYTKRASPPQRLLDSYASTGEPIEWWHMTDGYATTPLIKKWATRVRSIVHSFNPDAWILLIWDCSQAHLNADIVSFMRRLGILLVMIPAKLTWLVQVCDVFVFHELKTRLRMHKSFVRMRHAQGMLQAGDWISCCGSAVRDMLVNRSWEDAFDRMGLGANVTDMEGRAAQVVDRDNIRAALPTRAQFGRLVNKAPDTENFRRMHKSIMEHFLHVKSLPIDRAPPRGAEVPLPHVEPAAKRRRVDGHETWDEAMQSHLAMSTYHTLENAHHGRAAAINRRMAPPPED